MSLLKSKAGEKSFWAIETRLAGKTFPDGAIAGMVFGAAANRSTLNDITETGMMLYKKRRILERLKETEREME